MPYRIYLNAALFVVLSLAGLPCLSLAEAAVSKQVILDSLYKSEILPLAERNRLDAFALQLSEDDYSLKELEELALAVKNKVKRDLKSLSGLSFHLQELAENQFAQKVGEIKERSTVKLQKRLAEFEGGAKDIYQYRVLEEYKPNKDEFVKIIKHDIRLLVGAQGIVASFDVWKEIKSGFTGAYKKWNARFHELETSHLEDDSISETYGVFTKKKFYEEPTPSSKEYIRQRSRYDVEELEFMRDFARAQAVFRRLSNPNSWDF